MTPNNSEIKKDLRRITIPSLCVVLALMAIMMFSPYALQFYEEGPSRGVASYYKIDSLVEAQNYACALKMVDSIIANDSDGLPRFAYFDRFLSDEEYADASERRENIYELQWKRIIIMQESGDMEGLKQELKRYSRIVGFHQEEAKALLNLIND